MAISKYQAERKNREREKAYELHKKGIPLREIARQLNRSTMWAWTAVKVGEAVERERERTNENK